MTLEDKLYWTIMFGVGLPISYIFLLIVDSRLKKQLNITEPHWFFSKTKFKLIRGFYVIGYIIIVILIWTDQYIIPKVK